MKKLFSVIMFFFFIFSLNAQQLIIPLYDGVASVSENWDQKEIEYEQYGGKMVRNVVNPTLTVFLPDESIATGAAVVVAPGGGFVWLSWENEGTQVGEWLQSHGIAAFVLKYRLADTGTEEEFQQKSGAFLQQMVSVTGTDDPVLELQKYPDVAKIISLAEEDGRQAIKHVRENAANYKVNPDHIGMMGFSAGGVVTMGVALNHDEKSRPDFIAPIYGFAMEELLVPEDATPMFSVCAADDVNVALKSGELYKAWLSAGKSVEYHVFSNGGHGFGMRKQGLPVDNWIEQFKEWLVVQGVLSNE